MRELLPYLALAVSVIACAISAWTAIRAGRWRDTDEAQKLVDRLDEAEDRLTQIETKLEDLPTSADLAALKGEVHGLAGQVEKHVIPGLRRIEDFFVKEGMGGRS